MHQVAAVCHVVILGGVVVVNNDILRRIELFIYADLSVVGIRGVVYLDISVSVVVQGNDLLFGKTADRNYERVSCAVAAGLGITQLAVDCGCLFGETDVEREGYAVFCGL